MVGISTGVDISGKMDKSVYDADSNDKVNAIDVGVITPAERLKIVSDVLRHSIDGLVSKTTVVEWEKKKTLTFTNGIKGTLRIVWGLRTSTVNHTAYSILTNDGATPGVDDLGVEQTTDSDSYVTKTQDIAVDVAAGGTIDLWLKPKYTTSTAYSVNFRVYYNECLINVAVTGAD